MTTAKLRVARQMLDTGEHNIAEIARTIGVGRATLYRHLDPFPATARAWPFPPVPRGLAARAR